MCSSVSKLSSVNCNVRAAAAGVFQKECSAASGDEGVSKEVAMVRESWLLRLGVKAAALRIPVFFLRIASFYVRNEDECWSFETMNWYGHVYEVLQFHSAALGCDALPPLPWSWGPHAEE